MSNSKHASESSAFTLTDALRRLALERGVDLDRDAIHAALGLCWGIVAGDDDTPLSEWPGLARDRFLVPAATMFGIRVRGLHPPAAAKNLHAAAEFVQHFDASYRPLIHRALEHGQPVLAWRGWDSAPPLHWGVIRAAGDRGIGFEGDVPCHGTASQRAMEPAPSWEFEHSRRAGDERAWLPDEGHGWRSAVLVRCPTQVYAVEAIEPRMPSSDDLTALILDHARTALAGQGCADFGVLTGPAAIDRWITRIRDYARLGQASAAFALRTAEGHASREGEGQASREIAGRALHDRRALCEIEGHSALTVSLLDAAESGGRAIGLLLPATRNPVSIRRLAALSDLCGYVRETMSPWPDAESWQGLLSTDPGRRQVVEHLQLVRERLERCLAAAQGRYG